MNPGSVHAAMAVNTAWESEIENLARMAENQIGEINQGSQGNAREFVNMLKTVGKALEGVKNNIDFILANADTSGVQAQALQGMQSKSTP